LANLINDEPFHSPASIILRKRYTECGIWSSDAISMTKKLGVVPSGAIRAGSGGKSRII